MIENAYRQLLIAGLLLLVGCQPASDPTKKTGEKRFPNETVVITIEPGSPTAAAVRFGCNEWEARTGGKVEIKEGPVDDGTTGDLQVVTGETITRRAKVPALSKEFQKAFQPWMSDFASTQRLFFMVKEHAGAMVGVPVASDLMLLYYRSDLFDDQELAKKYLSQFKQELTPPKTWADYQRQAEFFVAEKKVEVGCLEPTDGTISATRVLLTRAASYAKSSGWAGFYFDTETGKPRLHETPFVRALEESNRARAVGGKGQEVRSAAQCDELFLAGKAAFLVRRGMIKLDKNKGSSAVMIGIAEPPGSIEIYAPAKTEPSKAEGVNRTSYLPQMGWYLVMTQDNPRPAVHDLMVHLVDRANSFYIIQGSRHGLIPNRASLLTESVRFSGLGLPSKSVSKMFNDVSVLLENENWVADLMVSRSDKLLAAMHQPIQQAMLGKLPARDALAQVTAQWNEILKGSESANLDEYRATLRLPPREK